MCREQLGKLPPRIGELTAEGAAVLGISIDTPEEAARLARELGLPFPILSDPAMEVIRAYRQDHGMPAGRMDLAWRRGDDGGDAAGPSAVPAAARSGEIAMQNQAIARRPVRILLAVMAPALVILALLAYGLTRDPQAIPTRLLDKPATPFTLTLFDGRQLSLEELRGQVVFLNFWASWCPPCRAEARTLEAAWQKYKDRDVVFLGVNIQDTAEAAREFLQEFGITYPNGQDGAGRVAIDYGVWGLPETFIIARDGRIAYKHIGALGWTTHHDEAGRGATGDRQRRGGQR